MSSRTEIEAWKSRPKASSSPIKFPDDLDTSDPRVGEFMTTPFGRGLILGRRGERYYLEMESGYPAWELTSELGQQNAPAQANDAVSVVAAYHASAEEEHRSRATQVLIDNEAIRMGLEPQSFPSPSDLAFSRGCTTARGGPTRRRRRRANRSPAR